MLEVMVVVAVLGTRKRYSHTTIPTIRRRSPSDQADKHHAERA
jgi:hypothetical protein